MHNDKTSRPKYSVIMVCLELSVHRDKVSADYDCLVNSVYVCHSCELILASLNLMVITKTLVVQVWQSVDDGCVCVCVDLDNDSWSRSSGMADITNLSTRHLP